jgi:integrase
MKQGPTRLTKVAIDRFSYSGTQDEAGYRRDVLWDSDITGLGVRAFPSGAKSFVLSYRVLGRKRLMTIGRIGIVSLEEARRLARTHLGAVAMERDPLGEKIKTRNSPVIQELCDYYIERHAKPHKKSWAEDHRRFRMHILPRWRTRQINSISQFDIIRLHQEIGENYPTEANRVLTLIGTAFEKAKQWGLLDPAATNPARGAKKFKEQARDRWVTHNELPRVIDAIDLEADPFVRAAFWLYLLTGVRRQELLSAKWTDIDFSTRIFSIRENKSGRAHHVPLSQPAIEILGKLPRQTDNSYVIPGRDPGKARVNLSKPWGRIRKRAGIEDVRIHDLRRTVGSWLAQRGNSLHLIGKILNHSSPTTTRVYARFSEDQSRVALEGHAQEILGAATTERDRFRPAR